MVYREWHKYQFNGVTVYLSNAPSNARYLIPNTKIEDCTVHQLAKRVGIPPSTVKSRLGRGMSLEEALTPGYAAGHKIKFGERTYNAKELSKILGLHKATIGKRIRAGWQMDELPTQNLRNRMITAFGETKRFMQWSRERKIGKGTLAHRLDVLHMSPELALTLPIDESRSKNAKKQKRIMKHGLE